MSPAAYHGRAGRAKHFPPARPPTLWITGGGAARPPALPGTIPPHMSPELPAEPPPNQFDTGLYRDVRLWLAASAGIAAASVVGFLTGHLGLLLTTAILLFGGTLLWRGVDAVLNVRHEMARTSAEHADPEFTLDHLRDTPAATGETITRQYGRALILVTELNPHCDRQKILEAIAAPLYARCEEIRFGAVMLPPLGLFGTVAGMTVALMGMEEGVQAGGDVSALSAAIQGSLGGMSAAFVTTLAACFLGSIVLGGMAFIVRQHIDQFVDRVAAQWEMVNPAPEPSPAVLARGNLP